MLYMVYTITYRRGVAEYILHLVAVVTTTLSSSAGAPPSGPPELRTPPEPVTTSEVKVMTGV
jgi:hypothetical protein